MLAGNTSKAAGDVSMPQRNQWEDFFDSHAPHYMENVFTINTLSEVDFLLEELELPAGSSILDVGCGTGRHAIELARRGYRVTGVDISSGMLHQAEKAATQAGVSVKWVHGDATTYLMGMSRPQEQFDAALCLCEGAFGLLDIGDDPEEHDRAVLSNINSALPIGATLIMTTLNGYRKLREMTQEDVDSGRFDPVTMVHDVTEELDLPGGKRVMNYRERVYAIPELVGLFRSEGFHPEHIWGGTAGNWGRRNINLDEIEVMIVARKVAESQANP
jgi:SAM-dependent methyltransferase